MDHKKYLMVVFAVCVTLLAAMGVANFVIDPMNYFRGGTRFSFYSSERELKSRMVESGNYQGLLLGSSKVTYIQPEDIAFNGPVLNAAFSGALPEEMRYFLEEKNPDVAWIAIGLDYFMFNENAYPYRERATGQAYFTKTPGALFSYALSLDTGLYSAQSLLRSWKEKPLQYTSSGARNVKRLEDIDRRSRVGANRIPEILDVLGNEHFKNYTFSQRRLQDMEKIRAWARERGIPVVVWLDPLVTPIDDLVKARTGSIYKTLPEDISRIFPDFINLTRAYPGAEWYFAKEHDPFHYYPSTGKALFQKSVRPRLTK